MNAVYPDSHANETKDGQFNDHQGCSGTQRPLFDSDTDVVAVKSEFTCGFGASRSQEQPKNFFYSLKKDRFLTWGDKQVFQGGFGGGKCFQ